MCHYGILEITRAMNNIYKVEFDLPCKIVCNMLKIMEFINPYNYAPCSFELAIPRDFNKGADITPQLQDDISDSFKEQRQATQFVPYNAELNVTTDDNNQKRFISDGKIFNILNETYTYPATDTEDGIRPLHVTLDIEGPCEWQCIDIPQLIYDAFLQTYSNELSPLIEISISEEEEEEEEKYCSFHIEIVDVPENISVM